MTLLTSPNWMPSLRWVVYPGAIVAGVVAILLAPPTGNATASSASWIPTEAELVAEAQSLTNRQAAVAERLAYKDVLVRDLVAGRTTLIEVNEAFLRLDRSVPGNIEALTTAFPGPNVQVKSARRVLGIALGSAPSAERGRQLEADFEALVHSY